MHTYNSSPYTYPCTSVTIVADVHGYADRAASEKPNGVQPPIKASNN